VSTDYRQWQPGERVRDKFGERHIVDEQQGCMVWIDGWSTCVHPNNLMKEEEVGMDRDCQQIAEAFRTISRAAMAINNILGRRDDLNETVPTNWPLNLSADKFAHECLTMAEQYEALASEKATSEPR
jgi:hypothetical protein